MDSLTLTDEQLVEEYSKGSLLCFDEVLTRYESKLFYFLKTIVGSEREAEESLQELAVVAFTRLSDSLPSTGLSNSEVEDGSSSTGAVKRWLFAQAISIAKFKLAAQNRDLSVEKVRLFDDLDNDAITLVQAVEFALAQIPLDYRMSFLLWDVAGFSLSDIALLTGGTLFEARMRIQRARLGIRKISLNRRRQKVEVSSYAQNGNALSSIVLN